MKKFSLCRQCTHLLLCDRAKEQNEKVYYCEDFQKSNNSSTSNEKIKTYNKSQIKKNNMENGLCRICQNREICKIQIPEGGLWHCENFF